MAVPAIQVSHLRKRFRKRRRARSSSASAEWALAGVSFDVAPGETYGLLGPNGSGKSTLIRILSTLLIADGGEVRVLGYRLPDEQAQVRRLIGRVSVDAAFYKKLSARENLLYTALLYGLKPSVAEPRAMDALERLGMDTTLSGANLGGVVVVLLASTIAFVGLGVMAAALPVLSPERGAEATHIFQGALLLVSGVYYPVEVLPAWIRPISAFSPATYTLNACRRLVGAEDPATTPHRLAGAPLSAVTFELAVLMVMGIMLLPLGLWIFGRVERWAKHTGRLKRTG